MSIVFSLKLSVEKYNRKLLLIFSLYTNKMNYVCGMEKENKRQYKKDEALLGINPFIGDMNIKVVEFEYGNRFKRARDGSFVNEIGEKDGEEKTFVYLTPAKRKHVATLSKAGKVMLVWLLYELESSKDYVWINMARYKKENKVASNTTYWAAINNLIEKEIIKRSNVIGYYWINPAYFFRGSRIEKYRDELFKVD